MNELCVFCGQPADTREHVIPRCFLDKPYPENLPTLASCKKCNNSFSKDEEYVMYTVDYLKSVEFCDGEFSRIKPQKTFLHNDNLELLMMDSIAVDENGAYFRMDCDRFDRVLKKIAYCIFLHDLGKQYDINKIKIMFTFISQLENYNVEAVQQYFNSEFQERQFAYNIISSRKLEMYISSFLIVVADACN